MVREKVPHRVVPGHRDDVPIEVATEPRPLSKRGSEPMAVLNNAFGFGGHNVSLVFTAA